MIKRAKARAYSNIALIKYWGKRDEELVLPMNSSLSLTLEGFFTETEVIFDAELEKDCFYLNGKLQDEPATEKISRFLDLFRNEAKLDLPAVVRSENFFPTAAGLASSASGFAALAAAANVASGLNLDRRKLSTYARRGSGSAARSIYGGFVEWQKGTCSEDSYATPIDDANWDIGMVVVMVNTGKKSVSSREGMKLTLATSPFYQGWLQGVEEDLAEIKKAIVARDLEKIGLIAERNALKMHAITLGANPPLLYWEPDTVLAMQRVMELRKEGFSCYFTMDAGPNVKILCRLSESGFIKERLQETFDSHQLVITGPGPGVTILEDEK